MINVGNRWRHSGFSIVEILIVVAVIAILAVLTVVAYNGLSRDSRLAGAQSDMKSELERAKLWLLEPANSSWPTTLANAQAAGLFSNSSNMTFDASNYIVNNTTATKHFCVSGTASDGSTKYAISSTADHAIPGVCVTNLILNPSFEESVTNWAVGNNATRNLSSVQKLYGDSSMYVVRTGSGDDFVSLSISTIPTGQVYNLSGHFYLTNSGTTASNRNFWSYSLGVGNPLAISYDQSDLNAWQRISGSATSGTGSPPWIARIHPLTGAQLYVDGLMMTAGSTLYSYGDGNSEGWFWNGAANNSTSTGPATIQ